MRRMRVCLHATVLPVLFLSTGFAGEPQLSGTPGELQAHLSSMPGQVVLSGTAERVVEADESIVRLSVHNSDRALKTALEESNRLRREIVATLSAGGIETNRIHTSRFSSVPSRSSWTGKVKAYDISSAVSVHARTEKEVQIVAGIVDTMEEVSLESLTFETTDKEAIALALLKKAFAKIEARKQLYEQSLEVMLHPRSVGIPEHKDRRGRERWMMEGGLTKGLRFAEALTNPECSVVLHALQQQPADLSQFDKVVYKVGVVVTFDVYPKDE